jgi:hypothetical protein
VNWSAADVALVPPTVVTVMSTRPAPSAGEVAVMEVVLLTVKPVAVVPNFTAVTPIKLVPVIVTDVPPAAGPCVGLTAVTVGADTYVNWSAADVALVPPSAVTVTSTIPVPAGDVAVICVTPFTVKLVAAVVPNFTAVTAVKFVPMIVTLVPPAVGPLLGVTSDTVGAPTYVNWSPAEVALVPPGVVTVMSTRPAAPAGETAVMEVALFTVKLVAAVAPNFTADAPVKFVPVIVTLVPPAADPLFGLTDVTVGAGTATATTDRTTEAELYVSCHPSPTGRVGKFVVANTSVTDMAVRIVNESPT